MAQVKTMAGIASISGRIGNYSFRTMRSTGKVYVHSVTAKERNRNMVAPTEAMVAQRERFGAITKMVTQMRGSGSKKSQKQLWKIASEAYDAAHK